MVTAPPTMLAVPVPVTLVPLLAPSSSDVQLTEAAAVTSSVPRKLVPTSSDPSKLPPLSESVVPAPVAISVPAAGPAAAVPPTERYVPVIFAPALSVSLPSTESSCATLSLPAWTVLMPAKSANDPTVMEPLNSAPAPVPSTFSAPSVPVPEHDVAPTKLPSSLAPGTPSTFPVASYIQFPATAKAVEVPPPVHE